MSAAALPYIGAASGIAGNLKGGGNQTSTPQVTGGMAPEVSAAFQNLMGQLQGMGPTQAYSGQMTAGMTPEQTAAMQMASGAQTGLAGIQSPANSLLAQTLSGQFLNPAANPYGQAMAGAISRPIKEQLLSQEDMLNAQAQMGGIGGSSPFMTQSRLMQERGMGQLGEQLSNLYGGIYGQERGAQQQALGMLPQYAMLPYQQAGALFGLGEGARGIEQQGLTAQYQDWLRTQGPSEAQKLQASMIGGMPNQTTQYGTSTQIPWYNQVGKGIISAMPDLQKIFPGKSTS